MDMYGLKSLNEVFEGKAIGVKSKQSQEEFNTDRVVDNILTGKSSNRMQVNDNIDLRAKTSPRLREKGMAMEGKIFGKMNFNMSSLKPRNNLSGLIPKSNKNLSGLMSTKGNKSLPSLMSMKPKTSMPSLMSRNKKDLSGLMSTKGNKSLPSLMSMKPKTSMPSLMSTKPKNKMVNVMSIRGKNANVKNIVQSAIGKTRNFEKLMQVRGTEQNLMWRMGQQRGLNMLGDFDKDGVPNALDCQPRNRWRQGPENSGNMDDLPPPPRPADFVEPYYDETQVAEEEPIVETYEQETIPPSQQTKWQSTYRGKSQQIPVEMYQTNTPKEPGMISKSWAYHKDRLLRGLGLAAPTEAQQKELENRAAFKSKLQDAMQQRAIRDLVEAKTRTQYNYEANKLLRGMTPAQKARLMPILAQSGYNVSGNVSPSDMTGIDAAVYGFKSGLSSFGGSQGKVASGLAVTGGSPSTLMRASDVSPTAPWSHKVLQTVGRKKDIEAVENYQQQMEQPPQYQQSYEPPKAKVKVVQSGKVYSPFSKRPVSYTRGPYNKNRIVIQQ